VIDMRPLGLAALRELAPHAVAHPRPFLGELVVSADSLSRLVPHVNNTEYLRWLDRVAELHAENVGCGREMLLASGCAWFVARHEIDYLAECWEDERLVVATWVRTMRKTTSWRDTIVVRPADATLVCRASTLWAYVDLATRRAVRAPDAMSEAFDVLQGPAGAETLGAPSRTTMDPA